MHTNKTSTAYTEYWSFFGSPDGMGGACIRLDGVGGACIRLDGVGGACIRLDGVGRVSV